jgi:hypothetical protein
MNADVRLVPRTKLWSTPAGPIIVLACVCGRAVDYPGHPDEDTPETCPDCGTVWRVES